MKNILTAIAFSAFMLSSTSSLAEVAETANDLKKFPQINAYVNSQSMLKTLYQVGVILDKKFNLQKGCQSKYKVKPMSIIITAPIDFPNDLKNPKSGSWRYKFGFERCGEEKIYNAAFRVTKPGETISASIYFPGTSYASPRLIQDALQAAVPIASAATSIKGCKNHLIQDMEVLKKPHTLKEDGISHKNVWIENWLISVCGTLVDTEMIFVPNTKRGGVDFHTRKAKLR